MARFGRSYPFNRVLHSKTLAGNQNKSSGDTGTGTDNQSISATLSSADTGTGTEGTPTIAFSSPDTGTGTDAQNIAATLSSSDTGTGTEANSIAATLSSSDTSSTTEASSIAATLSSQELITSLEGQQIGLSSGDSGSGSEGWSIQDVTPPHTPAVGKDNVLVQGPGTIYVGAYGALEPALGSVGTAPDSGVWTDVGGLLGGVELTVEQDWIEVELKQIPDRPMRRLRKRRLSIKTQMAEPTLANLGYALNDTAAVSGVVYEASNRSEASQLTYVALIIDGWAPGWHLSDRHHRRRRIIVRKALSIDNVTIQYSKTEQSVYTVTWSCHYVDGTTPPFRIIDEDQGP